MVRNVRGNCCRILGSTMNQSMNEYERRAIMYWNAFIRTGNNEHLFNYLFWRTANEFGKEYAQKEMLYIDKS